MGFSQQCFLRFLPGGKLHTQTTISPVHDPCKQFTSEGRLVYDQLQQCQLNHSQPSLLQGTTHKS
jgi:hypothetical protein